MEFVTQFAVKIKDTEKNNVARVLRSKYPGHLGEHNTVWEVIPLKAIAKRACSYVPVQLLR
jgi:hypothetical protein